MSKLEMLDELRRIGALYHRYERKILSDRKWLRNKDWLGEYREVVENEIEYYQEQKLDLEMQALNILKKFRFYNEWFVNLEGASTKLLIKILGFIDWRKAKHPSSLHALAGLVTPESEYYVKHNRNFKREVLLQGVCFLGFPPNSLNLPVSSPPRRRGGYARLYMNFRKESDEKHPDWNQARRFLDALRKTCRVFLTHLFVLVHYLDLDGRIDVHYLAEESGYIYMPPIDKVKEKPKWLRDLGEQYMRRGITPIHV